MPTNCLGPYIITCTKFPGQTGNVFIDNTKTKQIAVVYYNDIPEVPAYYRLLHQVQCDNKTIHWYELTGTTGRVYTIVPGVCGVSISSFENGLLDTDDCKNSAYGSAYYLFGQNYVTSTTQYFETEDCITYFEFEDTIFGVKGNKSDVELIDCSSVDASVVETFSEFGNYQSDSTNIPDEIPSIDVPSYTPEQSVLLPQEISWNLPDEWSVNRDYLCSSENTMQKGSCESNSNPAITILPDGKSLIAYEDRSDSGKNKISLAIFETSASNTLYFYRNMSRGTLVNKPLTDDGLTSFEVFEDFTIETDINKVPLNDYYIGFLTGPLKGITSFQIEKFILDTNSIRLKHTIQFNTNGRVIDFPSSNDICDVQWFIAKSISDIPLEIDILNIPVHKYNDVQVPIANPSVCSSRNNIMSGQDYIIYLTYQAYESNQWNVYLQQIRLSYNTQENPLYDSPFLFNDDEISQLSVIPDEYHPSIDISVDYFPASLYNLVDNGNIVTRVIYNLAAKNYIPDNTNVIDKLVDINFVVDYSLGNFSSYLPDLKLHFPLFDRILKNAGYSPQYGLTVFGQNKNSTEAASNKYTCNDISVYSGVNNQPTGFTNIVSEFQEALSRNVDGNQSPGYAAIRYSLEDAAFQWRSGASKVVIFISNHSPSDITCDTGDLPYSDSLVLAGDAINNNNAYVGFITEDTAYFDNLSDYSEGVIGLYQIKEQFRDILENIAHSICRQIVNSPVVEKSTNSSGVAYLNKARMSVTYDGDLSHLWTYHKDAFRFSDNRPDGNSMTQGLVNFPFSLYVNKISNIDPVHLIGTPDNWVFFLKNSYFTKGQCNITYPNFGYLVTDKSEPVLVSQNSTRPCICTNYNNNLYIACEDFSAGYPNIKIFGTCDFAQNSIHGGRGNRSTRFLTSEDLLYQHDITASGMGLNQMPSITSDKNNIIHVTWQSNRTGYWNIYYANGFDVFENTQLTNGSHQAYHPVIGANDAGNIFVAFHDNRFKNYEIFLAYNDTQRTLTLLEQNEYLASLRLNYTHYVNVLPIFVYNSIEQDPYDPYTEEISGTKKYHLLVSFFDNPNFDGEPAVKVDSRVDLDAFLSTDFQDNSLNYGIDGIDVKFGFSEFVYFTTVQTTRGTAIFTHQFEKNKTYFPKVVLIKDDGETVYAIEQRTSFSCSYCNHSTLTNNSSRILDCSADVIIRNDGNTALRSEFQITIFSDADKKTPFRIYTINSSSQDLSLFQVNNQSLIASGKLNDTGLIVDNDEQMFLQLYPNLTDIQCGITYYFEISQTTNKSDNISFEYVNENILHCDCVSKIFSSRGNTINELNRWHSSSFGYPDTRITNSTFNCLNPDISIKSDGSCILFFEKQNLENDTSTIAGASFRIDEIQNDLQASGGDFWYDYDPYIDGFNVRHELDLFDRNVFVYERITKPVSSLDKAEISTSTISFKNCELIRHTIEQESECNKDKILGNLIIQDRHISGQVIKKILLDSKDVKYYTYNSRKEPMPIVNSTVVRLQIWGTPEVVAIRLKNETDVSFSDWYSFRPEISDFYIEKIWTLTKNSGIKQVCVQAMTYSGITSSYCIQIAADYQTTTSTVNLFSDDQYSVELPTNNGLAIASTQFNKTTMQLNQSKTIYVEIIPHGDIEGDRVEFDVLMQGGIDFTNLLATRTQSSTGQVSYRGQFTIYADGVLNNKDGISQIVPRFNTEQINSIKEKTGNFVSDKYNVFSDQNPASKEEIDMYRQEISGEIGIPVLIRPNEDPYFIFGGHDFFTNRQQPGQKITI